jgi:hypothetical protein
MPVLSRGAPLNPSSPGWQRPCGCIMGIDRFFGGTLAPVARAVCSKGIIWTLFW